LFDVLANDRYRSATTRGCKIRRRPQRVTPQLFGNAWILLLANHAAGHAFETVDQNRHGNLGWVIDKEMDVIMLPVEFRQLSLKVKTDPNQTVDRRLFRNWGRRFLPVQLRDRHLLPGNQKRFEICHPVLHSALRGMKSGLGFHQKPRETRSFRAGRDSAVPARHP